ncbi:2-methylcitrate dehydratase [Xenorhabdus mauleonii]|uniref:2-methylcitrate dehydratase n=1 Tax=Xenorhabdus mauleonii TaxID=351675 RepID=A0A1I3PGQ2_9GAMM|nr:MmgE/PrpD family protein [Xenorhabdus mauleonii]PHM44811.1 2-methylcitrate dehydratase [Xenorhabdus mauleonii]SFJ20520.1 2-methylcitrate dehydratase PrpD [Xenorhabdus mauleonii]
MLSVTSIEDQITAFSCELKYDNIPSNALNAAHLSILDIFGVTLAGSVRPEIQLLQRVIGQWGGRAVCPVFGTDLRLPPSEAALLNGAASRVLDFDDVVDPLGIHPSVAIFPALATIAAIRRNHVTSREFLTATVIGQDLITRLARARKETLLESGRYDLSKVIAATAAAGRLFGLAPAQLRSAMGIAYTSALGEAQCMVEGAPTVSYQQGLVASNAVKAVLLASEGFDGTHHFLTGRYGLYSAFEPGSKPASIVEGLGTVFASEHDLAFKYYPTCRPNISATLLAISLSGHVQVRPEDIAHIDIAMNQQIYDLVCEPADKKWKPTTPVEARFSMAYTVAVGLRNGSVHITDYDTDALTRADVLSVSEKVRPRVDPKCDIPELGTHGRIEISIHYTNGDVRTGFVDIPKGHPQNPLEPADIIEKFTHCVSYFDPENGAMRAHNSVRAWERLTKDETALNDFLAYGIASVQ